MKKKILIIIAAVLVIGIVALVVLKPFSKKEAGRFLQHCKS